MGVGIVTVFVVGILLAITLIATDTGNKVLKVGGVLVLMGAGAGIYHLFS